MNSRQFKILMIDDNTFATDIFKKKLEYEGYIVSACINGSDGLIALQTNVPDLLLLDLMMPGIDGFSVLKIIRGRPQLKNLPVIVFSAKDTVEDRKKAFDLGAVDFLTKSKSTPNEVVSRIRKILEKDQSNGQAVGYRVSIKEGGFFDADKLARDFGYPSGLKCRTCNSGLVLDLVHNQAHQQVSFVATFHCPECSKHKTPAKKDLVASQPVTPALH